MAFENLSEKFQRIFKKIKGQSTLSETNIENMLHEIKLALIEADVNYKVCNSFLENVKNTSIGQQVLLKVNPSQMLIKIVQDELVKLLGGDSEGIELAKNRPTTIMLIGLQGTGKTTTAAKLANYYKSQGKKVCFAACDIYRPAAVEQLKTLASSISVPVIYDSNLNAVEIAIKAKEYVYNNHFDILILDTAGRLQIDEILMKELEEIKEKVKPDHVLLLIDALSGQDSLNVSKTFHDKLNVTGAIMSKLDSNAKGGAALSVAFISGVIIKFIGIGEKIDDFELFHPSRMAERILGMGDVASFVEKIQQSVDEKEAKRVATRLSKGKFTLDDLLKQLKTIQKMGSLGNLMAMIPGGMKITPEQKERAEKEMKLFETIINSMTFEERDEPSIIKNSRKIRIAKGSGTTAQDINKLLKRFESAKQMMKMMKGGNMPPFMKR